MGGGILGWGFGGLLLTVLAFAPLWRELYTRASVSYDVSLAAYKQRMADGVQPSTPVMNLFSIEDQEKVLVFGNLGYLVVCCLLYFLMQKREKAFQLKRVLTIYNLVNVLVSGFISVSILRYKLNEPSQSFICNRGEPEDQGLAYVFVLFYLQKFVEFLDTFFFLARKSFRQVTFLHLFHHASITVIVGCLLPFDYNGDMWLPIVTNSMVHVMVYLHYFFTCVGLHSWWNPYLASLQMGQFALILVHNVLAFIEGPQCGSPDYSKLLLIGYMGSMLIIFSDFFVKRYILKQPAYDMCGVIKSVEHVGGPTCSTFFGNAKLNANGQALVRMPPTFREMSPHVSVSYSYQLTPLNGPMPDLHISKELARTSSPGGGQAFIIGGGRPNATVSWMLCVIAGDDKIRSM